MKYTIRKVKAVAESNITDTLHKSVVTEIFLSGKFFPLCFTKILTKNKLFL